MSSGSNDKQSAPFTPAQDPHGGLLASGHVPISAPGRLLKSLADLGNRLTDLTPRSRWVPALETIGGAMVRTLSAAWVDVGPSPLVLSERGDWAATIAMAAAVTATSSSSGRLPGSCRCIKLRSTFAIDLAVMFPGFGVGDDPHGHRAAAEHAMRSPHETQQRRGHRYLGTIRSRTVPSIISIDTASIIVITLSTRTRPRNGVWQRFATKWAIVFTIPSHLLSDRVRFDVETRTQRLAQRRATDPPRSLARPAFQRFLRLFSLVAWPRRRRTDVGFPARSRTPLPSSAEWVRWLFAPLGLGLTPARGSLPSSKTETGTIPRILKKSSKKGVRKASFAL